MAFHMRHFQKAINLVEWQTGPREKTENEVVDNNMETEVIEVMLAHTLVMHMN